MEEPTFFVLEAGSDVRGCGWMTFPKGTSGGVELLGLDAGRGDGLGFVAEEGVGATEEFVEEGRDHPGPVTVEG